MTGSRAAGTDGELERLAARVLAEFGLELVELAIRGTSAGRVLRVDIDCGRVEVLRVISALDAGRVINPRLLEGQVEGGAVMGQGYALQERCVVREGMPVSLSLEQCGIPTATDAVPEIETVAVQTEEPRGPFGARGIGEITMISIVPAITAAIHAATGVWMDQIPVLPQRLLAVLQSRVDGPPND